MKTYIIYGGLKKTIKYPVLKALRVKLNHSCLKILFLWSSWDENLNLT